MDDSTDANRAPTHAYLVEWQRRLEQEYSLRELEGLSWRLHIDPEFLPHQTKPELSLALVQYLYRNGNLTELETEHEKYRTSRQDTLSAYRRRVLAETEFVELKGIPLPRGRDGRVYDPQVPLDKVYIHLQAVAGEEKRREEASETRALEEKTRQAGERKAASREPGDFLAGLRTLGEYLYRQGQVYQAVERPQPVSPQQALAKHERLVILGPPGSGKSTLLRFLARRAAEDEQERVPILVSLRDFANTSARNRPLNLLDFALKMAAGGRKELRRALEATVEQGRVLWLLDALDETRELADEIAPQVSRLPGPLVLTSRPVGYRSGPLHTLPHFEVLPLTPENVDRFLYDWLEIFVEENNEANAIEQRVARLKAQLGDRPQLQALTRNPLLLTFMVTLASQSEANNLPQQRVLFYDRYIEQLRDWEIHRQAQASGDPHFKFQLGSLTGEKAKQVTSAGLNYLGWALHLNYYGGQGAEPPGRNALIRKLSHYLGQDGYSDAENLAADVIDFWQTACMLDEWELEGHGYLAFRHLTFQEYAAAWGLQRAWERNKAKAWRFLKPRLHHPSWREPILLWSSLLPETELSWVVRRLQRGISQDEHTLHRDLRLAVEMLGESQGADEKTVRQIARRLAWLGRSHTWVEVFLLLFSYSMGLIALFMLPTFFFRFIAATIWSTMFAGCFLIPVFPRLQSILGLPLLIIRGVVSTPFDEARDKITSLYASLPIPYSLTALRDKNWIVRKEAATALGQIGDTAAVLPLLAALRDKNWMVRIEADKALGQIGDATAVPPLLADLRDKNWIVRMAAASRLGQIEDAAALATLLDKNWNVHKEAAAALGQIGDATAVPPLLAALRDKNWIVRMAAATALGQIGDATAVLPLLAALRDKNWMVRIVADRAFSQIGGAVVVPSLLAALRDENADMRKVAAAALGRRRDATAVPSLLAALRDENADMRKAAASALGQIGDAAAVPSLLAALRDENADMRKAVASALGQIGDAAAVPPLLAALRDENADMRKVAASALDRIWGDAAVPSFLAALRDENADMRKAAASALGEIGHAAAVPSLLAALRDKNRDVREAAARNLGNNVVKINDLAELEIVQKALRHRVTDIDLLSYNRSSIDVQLALAQVVNRITELSVSQLTLTDPLLSASQAR